MESTREEETFVEDKLFSKEDLNNLKNAELHTLARRIGIRNPNIMARQDVEETIINASLLQFINPETIRQPRIKSDEWVSVLQGRFMKFITALFNEYELEPLEKGIDGCLCKTCGEYCSKIDDEDDCNKDNRCHFMNEKCLAKEPKLTCKCSVKQTEVFQLFKYQEFLTEYMRNLNMMPYSKTGTRGLLVFHQIGSGKSLSSINMAEVVRPNPIIMDTNKYEIVKRRVILMIPASLHENPWVAELKGHGGINASNELDIFNKGYRFFHYNGVSVNTPTFLRSINNVKEGQNPFDNTVIVIDEVHNFINMLYRTKDDKRENAIKWKIYKWIVNSINSRVILLSGTPMMNTSFEIAFIINMIRGKEFFDVMDEKTRVNFMKKFINNNVINKRLFPYLNGIISYYKGADESVFPRKEIIIEQHEFTDLQYEVLYSLQNVINNNKNTSLVNAMATLKRAELLKSVGTLATALGSAMHIESTTESDVMLPFPFQNCNMAYNMGKLLEISKDFKYPGDKINSIINPNNYKDALKIMIDKIIKISGSPENKDIILKNIAIFSPKYASIIRHILLLDVPEEKINEEKGPVLVYSHYKEAYGIGALSKFLEIFDYREFKLDNFETYNNAIDIYLSEKKKSLMNKEDYEAFNKKYLNDNIFIKNLRTEIKNSGYRYYTFWTGDEPQERQLKLTVFNNVLNKYGNIIHVLLITAAGKEGINLRAIRQVHIMEPWWHNVQTEQVIGRAIRICSHAHLPHANRIVKVYKHYAVSKILNTYDEIVQSLAEKKQKEYNSLIRAAKEVAIDCRLNKAQNVPDDADDIYDCYDFDDEEILNNVQEFTNNVLHDPRKQRLIKKTITERQMEVEKLEKTVGKIARGHMGRIMNDEFERVVQMQKGIKSIFENPPDKIETLKDFQAKMETIVGSNMLIPAQLFY